MAFHFPRWKNISGILGRSHKFKRHFLTMIHSLHAHTHLKNENKEKTEEKMGKHLPHPPLVLVEKGARKDRGEKRYFHRYRKTEKNKSREDFR